MREKHENKGPRSIWVPIAVAIAISLVLSGIVLFVAASMSSGGQLPQQNMNMAAAVACFVGALFAGTRAVALIRSKALLSGIAGALGYFLVLFILGSVVFFRWLPTESAMGMIVAALVGGLIAGLLGSTKRKRKR